MKKRDSNKFLILFILFGFYGFKGFSGIKGDATDLFWFACFGNFSYFWWSKLSKLEDERLISNKRKAGLIAFRTCFTVAFALSILSLLQPNLNFEVLYRTQLLIVVLAVAISANLWAFLTYRFDMKE
jgi:hypothetical protein